MSCLQHEESMFQMSSSGVLCNVCPKALLDEEQAVGTAACSMGRGALRDREPAEELLL